MKKNMLTMLVLVLTIVNLSLSAFVVFTVVPNMQRSNELIVGVAKLVNAELESQFPTPEELEVFDVKNAETFALGDLRANLKNGADGKARYAQLSSCSITMNKEHDDFDDLKPQVEILTSNMKQIITVKVSQYTAEQVEDEKIKAEIRESILKEFQETLFKSTFIVEFTMEILVM